MEGLSREAIRVAWQKQAIRCDWQLVTDENHFIEQVQIEARTLVNAGASATQLHLIIQRTYSKLLYAGIVARQDRAAQEIWLLCLRFALRDGIELPQAQEMAQETVKRVIEKLHSLRSPQSLIPWTLMILRTVRGNLKQQTIAEEPFPSNIEGDQGAEAVASSDVVAEVEEKVLGTQLVHLLHAKLPNELERLTLLRYILFNDQPRDVAHDLGLPLYRTRVAKCRALQRLRGDSEFMAFIQTLVGSTSGVLRSIGA